MISCMNMRFLNRVFLCLLVAKFVCLGHRLFNSTNKQTKKKKKKKKSYRKTNLRKKDLHMDIRFLNCVFFFLFWGGGLLLTFFDNLNKDFNAKRNQPTREPKPLACSNKITSYNTHQGQSPIQKTLLTY